jgi:hypothetical protein
MRSYFHCRFGLKEHLRDFLEGKPFNLMQQHGFALLVRQLRERVFQRFFQAWIALLKLYAYLLTGQHNFAPHLSFLVAQGIQGDGVKPRLKAVTVDKPAAAAYD